MSSIQSRIPLDQSSRSLSLLPDAVSISPISSVVSLSSSHFNAFVHIVPVFWTLFPSCCQSSTLFSPVLGESTVFLFNEDTQPLSMRKPWACGLLPRAEPTASLGHQHYNHLRGLIIIINSQYQVISIKKEACFFFFFFSGKNYCC